MDKNLALETLKSFMENTADVIVKDAILTLHPELAESEDERIRKGLIAMLSQDKELHHKAIAYLEKQKEQKPLICDGEIEDRKRDIVAAIRKFYPADYAEYLTSFLKGLSPEDNSEDEYGQKMLGIAYKLMYEHIPENLRTQEFWDSLKFMREYTGKVAIIHSYEKPAEWSGEDKDYYDRVCTSIEWSRAEGHITEDECLNQETWLKSLRPQPHLKPSEEQMEALFAASERIPQKQADYNDGRDDVKMMVLDLIDSLQQEQPETDLEKEIDEWLKAGHITDTRYSDYCDDDIKETARHFYELGLNAIKEE